GNSQEQQQMSDRFPPIRGTVKPQEPVLPPVVASPARQCKTHLVTASSLSLNTTAPLYASPLPPVTARTTENTPVVDVVHAAQVPNMAPSAVAQPPVIFTERELLQMRQGGNLYYVLRGTTRREPFHFCLFCSLTPLSSQASSYSFIVPSSVVYFPTPASRDEHRLQPEVVLLKEDAPSRIVILRVKPATKGIADPFASFVSSLETSTQTHIVDVDGAIDLVTSETEEHEILYHSELGFRCFY
ncbi:hypothetical protein PROFUN_11110, partial [Planoprotostelium fungivorum]